MMRSRPSVNVCPICGQAPDDRRTQIKCDRCGITLENKNRALLVKRWNSIHRKNVVDWHLMDEASPPEGLDVLVTREHLGQDVIAIDSVFDFDNGMAYWYNGDETYKAWAYLPEPYDDSEMMEQGELDEHDDFDNTLFRCC